VASGTVQLQLDRDFNDPVFVVYVGHDGCPILGFTGTRFDKSEVKHDLLPDADMAVCGAHRLVYENSWIYDVVRKVASKYAGRKLYVTGHSLGGSRALIAAMGGDGTRDEMDVSNLVDEAHLFNPGSGLEPVACQGSAERVKAKIFAHRIFGDMCSITNFPCLLGGKLKVTVYEKHCDCAGDQLGRHTMKNFLSP
jgi:hypothetical protein